jgi:nucleotide-binding universal stress UspA family protein
VLEPAAKMMRDHGIKADLLELDSIAADDPADTIVQWAGEHDLTVLGETKPSVREILFGTVPERIVTSVNVPVIVVRHEDEDVSAAEQATRAA